MPDQEQFVDLQFPFSGLDVTHEYELQPDGSSANAVNVVVFEPKTGRGRGGSRPGLSKFNDQLVYLGLSPTVTYKSAGKAVVTFNLPTTYSASLPVISVSGVPGNDVTAVSTAGSKTFTMSFKSTSGVKTGNDLTWPFQDSAFVGPGGIFVNQGQVQIQT